MVQVNSNSVNSIELTNNCTDSAYCSIQRVNLEPNWPSQSMTQLVWYQNNPTRLIRSWTPPWQTWHWKFNFFILKKKTYFLYGPNQGIVSQDQMPYMNPASFLLSRSNDSLSHCLSWSDKWFGDFDNFTLSKYKLFQHS